MARIKHIALTTQNPEKVAAFYKEAFGLQEVRRSSNGAVFLTDGYATVERLAALRRMGVKVAIDDFGTGYSSLSYLRRLPIDAVKIDRTFIEQLAGDSRQAALVEAIVGLCRSLDLQIIAEGVEGPDQARRLLELGCHLAQGYELGRPKPASALRARLRKQPKRTAKTGEPVARRHQIAADDWRGKNVSA